MARDVLTVQLLVAGRISDAITAARPTAPPRVALVRDGDGRPVENATVRVLPDGLYAVHGDPSRVLPPAAVTLRLEVSAEGYASAARTVAFTAADLARVARPVDFDGETVEVDVIAGVPRTVDVALAPRPVTLKGRISRAEDRAVPIAGASVRITAPSAVGPVVTDAGGFFTLGPAPVAATVTLSITAPGREPLTPEVRLDFRTPVNNGAFALEPS